MCNSFIQDYLTIVEKLFVVLGVFFVAVQIRRQTKASRADHDRQKKQSTIEFYNSLSTESDQFLDDIKNKTLDWSTVNPDKVMRKSIIRYLSRMERLAVGIASDVYDFKILCLMSGRHLTKQYVRFKIYIEEARIHKDAPMLYKEFELLAKRIDEYRKQHPNQIVDKSFHVQKP